jgi:hypothetical protein
MFLNIPLQANLISIQQRRQLFVNENLIRQNAKRLSMDWVAGQRILIKEKGIKSKLSSTTTGPFTITQVYSNGTVRIRRNKKVTERIIFRRLIPYI